LDGGVGHGRSRPIGYKTDATAIDEAAIIVGTWRRGCGEGPAERGFRCTATAGFEDLGIPRGTGSGARPCSTARRWQSIQGQRRAATGSGTCEHQAVRIRRATTSEAGAVADVWLRSRAASVPVIPAPVHSEGEVRAWFRDVVLPGKEVWVADDGDIVAILVLDHDWIDQIYVEPGRTGGGIGASLIAVAKRQQPSGLRLWTFEANIRARRFYEHHGFVATGATAGDNEEGAPDVRYEWTPSAR
jgi:GNAT superfamily N-acetyltransferase